MNLGNKIFQNILTLFLMLAFLLVAFLFITERSIFGSNIIRNGEHYYYDYNTRNIILMVVLSLVFVIVFVILSSIRNKSDRVEEAGSILSKRYWRTSANELLDMKKLIFASLMLSIMLVSRFWAIPFGTMFITWRFIPFAMVALVLGPVGTIIIGVSYSILAWALFIPAPFLFTVPIDRAIEGAVYGILLYKTRISLTRIITLVFVISFIVSTIVNGLMLAIFLHGFESFEQIRIFIIANRFPRDAIMFIPKIVLIYLTLKYLLPIFKVNNFVDENVPEDIKIL